MDGQAARITTVLNFRDVGTTVNRFLGRKLLREGLLYRSARPDNASPDDQRLLRDDLGVASIIDLRTDTELVKAARKGAADIEKIGTASSGASPGVPRIPGIPYHHVKLTGRAFELHLVRQLSFLSFLRFLLLFLCGFRIRSIAVLGREVMVPMGLVGMGIVTIDRSGREFAQALRICSAPGGLPAVVHCTQGKDRTGLVVCLVLMILGVPPEAIEHDYSLSDGALDGEREERLVEIRSIGLTEDWMRTAKGMVSGIRNHLDAKHGGLDPYLDSIGFPEEDREILRGLLLC